MPKQTKNIKQNIEIEDRNYTLIEYAKMIYNEYILIKNKKIPTKILNIYDNELIEKFYIVNEDFNEQIETIKYILYTYKKINLYYIDEYKQIIKPINDYINLKNLLKTLTENEILNYISEIKNTF